jgi:hypothetical protein
MRVPLVLESDGWKKLKAQDVAMTVLWRVDGKEPSNEQPNPISNSVGLDGDDCWICRPLFSDRGGVRQMLIATSHCGCEPKSR